MNYLVPGEYRLVFNYTDQAGNTAQTILRQVNVVDTTPPVITLNGDANITIEAGSVYVDAGAMWTDAVDGCGIILFRGNIDCWCNVDGHHFEWRYECRHRWEWHAGAMWSGRGNAGDYLVPGEYRLVFNYSDQAGNTAQTILRQVNVVDTTPPVVTLNGDTNVTIEAGSVYVDAGAMWSDAVDGNGSLTGVGQVDYLVPGEYRLVFNYSDKAGNPSDQLTRTMLAWLIPLHQLLHLMAIIRYIIQYGRIL